MFVNLHTHHPALAEGDIELESIYFGQQKLPRSNRCSVGLHPWYLNDYSREMAEQWLLQEAGRPETFAIGEAGLDKVTATAWEIQQDAFDLCCQVSEQLHKPLVIHCVRAFNEILELKKRLRPLQPWIFHGFDKNAATARMLLQAGCYLSFGAALFRHNSHAADAFRQTPSDRFFLETDDSDLSIQQVYARAAEVRGITSAEVEHQVWANFQAVFG